MKEKIEDIVVKETLEDFEERVRARKSFDTQHELLYGQSILRCWLWWFCQRNG